MRAAIYVRVSLDDGRQTVQNQEQQLMEFCRRMNWQVVAEFQDAQVGEIAGRPGFKKMMESASKRELDVLVFWDLSRLSRGGVIEILTVLEQLKVGESPIGVLQESYI